MRDRIGLDAAEMAPLVESLRTRGQQTPVEVVALEGGRYGLISGWRRVQALRRLCAETGDAARFGTVLALLRQPRDAAEAYVAMVEEAKSGWACPITSAPGSWPARLRPGFSPRPRARCAPSLPAAHGRGGQRSVRS